MYKAPGVEMEMPCAGFRGVAILMVGQTFSNFTPPRGLTCNHAKLSETLFDGHLDITTHRVGHLHSPSCL